MENISRLKLPFGFYYKNGQWIRLKSYKSFLGFKYSKEYEVLKPEHLPDYFISEINKGNIVYFTGEERYPWSPFTVGKNVEHVSMFLDDELEINLSCTVTWLDIPIDAHRKVHIHRSIVTENKAKRIISNYLRRGYMSYEDFKRERGPV